MSLGCEVISVSYTHLLPPLSEGDFIRPEHNVMQIIDIYPEMGEFLMEYGMSCVGCFVSYDENLWQASHCLLYTSRCV